MTSLTNELKVGAFVIISLVLVAVGYAFSVDGVRSDEASYVIHLTVDSADGVYKGSPVRLAGVPVGSVDRIEIDGDRARMTLRLREEYKLPADTIGELKASGLLGDYYVRLYPGTEDAILEDGGIIRERDRPGDIGTITRNAEGITEDIQAITKILREMAEDRSNREHIEATLANVDGLTEELRYLAERNAGDVDAIIDSIRRLSEALEGHVDEIAGDVDDEMDRLKELTDELDRSATNITSITGKVDRGEGTIGALVNDRTTIDEINDTVENVNSAVGSIFGLRPELRFISRFYLGTEPTKPSAPGVLIADDFPNGNELAGSNANFIGVNLRAQSDFWYTFELVDHPQGTVTQREVYRETTDTFETRWVRERGFKFSFYVNKRWGPAAFRLGLMEGGGGAGVSFYAWHDRIQIGGEVFSFRLGSYPAVAYSGIPNSRIYFRIEPTRGLYLEAGAEQIILGAVAGYFTGFLGIGFHFQDNNLRGVFTALPAGSL